eukprot:1162075-Pelagomonas_calceolata.AAC.15
MRKQTHKSPQHTHAELTSVKSELPSSSTSSSCSIPGPSESTFWSSTISSFVSPICIIPWSVAPPCTGCAGARLVSRVALAMPGSRALRVLLLPRLASLHGPALALGSSFDPLSRLHGWVAGEWESIESGS